MKKNQTKNWLSRTTVLAGFAGALLAPMSFAQEADTIEPADAPVEEARQATITITGTRIPQANLIGTSPVTEIGAQEIVERGVIRVEDVVNTLPQAFAAQGSAVSNGATGTATVNLRGLGASRTLVLKNGRRLPYGSPQSTPSDLNQIPAALIERVDVLTRGASAVYGSDAISGVVNFIMKDDFEGVRIDSNYSFYQHNNDNGAMQDLNESYGFDVPNGNVTTGEAFDITGIMGVNTDDGAGNITAYISYHNIEPVTQGEYDYANCALSGAAPDFGCGGSSTNQVANLLNLNPDIDLGWFRVLDGEFTERDFTTDIFNYNPYNYYQRPDERYAFGAAGHYEFNKNVDVYTDISFMENHTVAQIAPSGIFGGGVAGYSGGVNCDNPYLSAQQVDYLCTANGLSGGDIAEGVLILRRNVEGGNRQDDLTHSTFTGIVGVRGEIMDTGIQYDVYGNYGKVKLVDSYLNELSVEKASKALYAVDDGSGNIVCNVNVDADGNNDDPACVPYDIFSPAGPSQASLNYMQSPLLLNGVTTVQNLVGTISGDASSFGGKLPTAEDFIGFAAGVEYRRNYLNVQPDRGYISGDGYGQGGPTTPVSGSVEVFEYFGELDIPLVQNMPGIFDLGIDMAYRFSSYTEPSVDTNTYKVGADYAPIEGLRFRASYQQAARAANVIELYDQQSVGLFDLTEGDNGLYDPCAGDTPAATAEQCALTGVTAAQYGNIADNPAGQFNALFGGNADLDPEESETVTVGVVWTPTFIEGLSVSVDYFDITVEGFIDTIDPSFALNQCLTTASDYFCSLVNRGNGGTLWASPTGYIQATNLNTGELKTNGFDVNASYLFDIGTMGSLGLDYTATILDELSTKPLPTSTGDDIYDSVGYYSGQDGTPNPDYRHKAQVSWETPWNVSTSLTWRHFAGVEIRDSENNPFDAQDYFDVSASYSPFETTSLRVGINNVMDEEPPVSSSVGAGFGNGNTYPQVYDALGRYIFVGITQDF